MRPTYARFAATKSARESPPHFSRARRGTRAAGPPLPRRGGAGPGRDAAPASRNDSAERVALGPGLVAPPLGLLRAPPAFDDHVDLRQERLRHRPRRDRDRGLSRA